MMPNKLTPGYNLLWESSRMMLPEHREQLLKERRKWEEFHLPILDEQQLAEINIMIAQAFEQKQVITITYAKKYQPASFCGLIQKINTNEASLKISNDKDTLTLFFEQILHVEFA
ncbi:YolD-like family protein [Bacillus sp. FJAT-50079]|uniref:YolD-like family protein n=1 Tax=Bacillus sp. FJAT-50079 TaxID=2833577 RepID=UPI001BC9FC24|nr:YolD-like family protein [Bacillus sp. FJAT-50079]MBS4209680.1 YolD-like family protein [Bacillus sp. FJAT-50079]